MQALALKPINLTFQENGHVHLLDGKPVPGCTSISGLFMDDGWKFAWPPKVMYEEIMSQIKFRNGFYTGGGPSPIHPNTICLGMDEIEKIVGKAKSAWRRIGGDAANKGTDAHSYMEDYIKFGTQIPPTVNEEVRHCFNEFIRWEREFSPIWLATELQVGSEKHRYAGILDALCQIDGKTVLLDYKTSKEIKPEYNIQLAGLVMALEEMGMSVDQRAILHLPKALKNEYEYRIIETNLAQDKADFLSGLDFYGHLNLFLARTK